MIIPSGGDDTIAIQTAIEAQLGQGGGEVRLAPGEFTITATITLDGGPKGACVSLVGSGGIGPIQWREPGTPGRPATVVRNNSNGDAIRINGTGTRVADLAVLDGMHPNLSQVDSDLGSSGVRDSGAGIWCGAGGSSVCSFSLERVFVHGHMCGIRTHRAMASEMRMVRSQSAISAGFWLEGGTSLSLTSCYARAAGRPSSAGHGFLLAGVSYCSLTGCASDYSSTHGYLLTADAGGAWCEAVSAVACGAEGSGGAGFYLDSPRGAVLSAPMVSSSGTTGIVSNASSGVILQSPVIRSCPIGIESKNQMSRGTLVVSPRFNNCGSSTNYPDPSGDRGVNNGVETLAGGNTSLVGFEVRGDNWKATRANRTANALEWEDYEG